MRPFINLIAGLGDWLVSLSDRTRMQLTVGLVLLLIGGGIYKLIVSLERLKEPLPAATPAQLIGPMEKLFERTKDNVNHYQQTRQHDLDQLDSLAKAFPDKKQAIQ